MLTPDGIFEFEESVPTVVQFALGEKVLSEKLKTGGIAANFLKINPTKHKSDPDATSLIVTSRVLPLA